MRESVYAIQSYPMSYNSILVLLTAVCFYMVYWALDTLLPTILWTLANSKPHEESGDIIQLWPTWKWLCVYVCSMPWNLLITGCESCTIQFFYILNVHSSCHLVLNPCKLVTICYKAIFCRNSRHIIYSMWKSTCHESI